MFFSKKNISEESNVAKKGIKKMDAVVTGVILSGIIASLYWVKKLRDRENQSKDNSSVHSDIHEEVSVESKKSFLDKLFRR